MNVDRENLEARVDRDKREEEAAMLLFLLWLFSRAQGQALAAVRVGANPFASIADVITGNASLGLKGGSGRLTTLLKQADARGFRRTLLIVPGAPDALDLYQPATDYASIAGQALAKMLQTILQKLSGAFVSPPREAVVTTFETGGYTDKTAVGPWALARAATALVGQAFNAGYFNGLVGRVEARAVITGFQYSSVLDNNTTAICRAYDDVKLPPDHPWWLTHWPLNHYGCRAVIKPLVGRFNESSDPPVYPPPMLGFGIAPRLAFGLRVGQAA